MDGVSLTAIQTSGESFSDNDTSVMTSASVQDKILSYGYTTNVGDITGVTAGTNLSGGGTSGAVTINLTDPFTVNEGIIKHLRSSDGTLYLGNSSGWELRLTSSELTPYTNGGLALGNASYYFAGLYSSTWLRTSGTTGWYSQTYGGGWQMTDTTWVRTYNSKGMLCNGIAATLSGVSSTSGYQYVMRNTTYGSFAYYTSSQDYKDEITPFTDSGATIDALHPVTFVEKPNEEDSPEEAAWRAADLNYGFIAEDIAGDPLTAHLGQYVDVDGELKPEGWKWPDMISVLAAEVKSLRQRVAELETP